MKYYIFTRFITKKEAINKYGKLGFTIHKEGVIILSNSFNDAEKQIKPYNYKKHIKFVFSHEVPITDENKDLYIPDEIVDLGLVRILD